MLQLISRAWSHLQDLTCKALSEFSYCCSLYSVHQNLGIYCRGARGCEAHLCTIATGRWGWHQAGGHARHRSVSKLMWTNPTTWPGVCMYGMGRFVCGCGDKLMPLEGQSSALVFSLRRPVMFRMLCDACCTYDETVSLNHIRLEPDSAAPVARACNNLPYLHLQWNGNWLYHGSVVYLINNGGTILLKRVSNKLSCM